MASKKIYVDIDLKNNKLQNSVIGSNYAISAVEGAISYGTAGLEVNDNGAVYKVIHTGNVSEFVPDANNGLTKIDNKIQLGGELLNNTTIDANGKDLVLAQGVASINLKTDGYLNVGVGANNNATYTIAKSPINEDIIIGGSFTNWDGNTVGNVVRFDKTGLFNTSFNTSIGTGFDDGRVFSCGILPTGIIIFVGEFTSFNGGNISNYIYALNDDGTPNTTFNTNIGTGFELGVANLSIVTIDTVNNGILIGGSYFNSTFNGSPVANSLIRLNFDGTLDTTFNTNLGTGFDGTVQTIAVQSDGAIFVGGNFTNLDVNPETSFVKLNSDGTIDTAFMSNVGTGFDYNVSNIAIQTNGGIVISGGFTTFNGTTLTNGSIIRLTNTGTFDSSFQTTMGTGYRNQFGMTAPYLTVDTFDDSIILYSNPNGGDNFDGHDGLLFRISSSGAYVNTFGAGIINNGPYNTSCFLIDYTDSNKLYVLSHSKYSNTSPFTGVIRFKSNGLINSADVYMVPTIKIAGAPLEYETDLSASYTNRSFVDKAYVDSKDVTFSNTTGLIPFMNAAHNNFDYDIYVRNTTSNFSAQKFALSETGASGYILIDANAEKTNLDWNAGPSLGSTGFIIDKDTITVRSTRNTIPGGFVGMVYGANYANNYTNRSLVDKQYVDNKIYQAGTAGSGASNFWPLSGSASLTDNVIIDGASSYGLQIVNITEFNITSNTNNSTISANNGTQIINSNYVLSAGQARYEITATDDNNVTQSEITAQGGDHQAFMRVWWNGFDDQSRIGIQQDKAFIESTNPVFSGAQYGADFSANYVDRSLVDKKYVDDKIYQAGTAGNSVNTASNGLTIVGQNVQLGGSLTVPLTTIDTAGKGLVIGNTTNGQLEFHSGFNSAGIREGYDGIFSMLTDNSNNLIVAGQLRSRDSGSQYGIEKLNAQGVFQTWAPAYFNSSNNLIESIAYDETDDKVYVIGGFTQVHGNSTYTYIVRLNNSDGTIDTSFVPGAGAGSFDISPAHIIFDQIDRKIYVGGYFTTYAGNAVQNVIRINLDGSQDTSFNIVDPDNLGATKIILDRSNSFIYAFDGNLNSVNRYALTDGTIDTAYKANMTGVNGTIYDFILDPNNNAIVIVGTFTTVSGVASQYIASILSDGTTDTTFATNIGSSFTATIQDPFPTAIAYDFTQSNYLIAGGFTAFNSIPAPGIMRMSNVGALIPLLDAVQGFNANSAQYYTYVNTILVNTNGSFYAGGEIAGSANFGKYNTDTIHGLVRVTSTGANDNVNSVNLSTQISSIVLNPVSGSIISNSSNNSGNQTTIVNTLDSRHKISSTILHDEVGLLTSSIIQTDTSVLLKSENNGSSELVSITTGFSNNDFLITDNRTTPTGIEYAADYSANYTSRSLVDKGYIDTALSAGSLQSGSGITVNNPYIDIGGGITHDTFLYSNGNYEFNVGVDFNEFKLISFRTALSDLHANTVIDSNIGSITSNVSNFSINASTIILQDTLNIEQRLNVGVSEVASIVSKINSFDGAITIKTTGTYSTSSYASIESWNGSQAAFKVANLDATTHSVLPYTQSNLTSGTNGLYYGVGFSTIYTFDPVTRNTNVVYTLNDPTEGSSPNQLVYDANVGLFYGTTNTGGVNSTGELFKFDPNSNVLTTVYDFITATGDNPNTQLVLHPASGKYYGTTNSGGSLGGGVIYSYDFNTSTYTNEIEFDPSTPTNGFYPNTIVWNEAEAAFYGTQYTGGANNKGVIYKFDPVTITYTVQYDFTLYLTIGTASPTSFVLNPNGKFYGVNGYTNIGAGLIYEFDPATVTYTEIYNIPLDNDHGAMNFNITFGLTSDNVGDTYYGLAIVNGSTSAGYIWSFNITSSIFTRLYSFNSDVTGPGYLPSAAFTYDTVRNVFYGTTYNGSETGNGSIYLMKVDYSMLASSFKLLSTGGAIFTDSRGIDNLYASTPKGIEYASDYSATYSNRSLVDKAFVVSYVTNHASTSGGGSGWTLDGTSNFVGDVTIDGTGTYDLTLQDFVNFVLTTSSGGQLHIEANSGTLEIIGDASPVTIESNGTDMSFIVGGILTIEGQTPISFAGAQYATDYSANYTNRSLVDKAFVVNQIYQAGTAGNSSATKYVATITGDSSTTDFVITHNLSSYDVLVQVFNNTAPRATVEASIERTTVNSIDVIFNTAPLTGVTYRVLIINVA